MTSDALSKNSTTEHDSDDLDRGRVSGVAAPSSIDGQRAVTDPEPAEPRNTGAPPSQVLPRSDALEADASTESDEPPVIEPEPERITPPPPPSLRPRNAPGATSMPLGITARLAPPSWPPKTAADLMTRKLITVQEHEPIGELESAMEALRFHHLPVVQEDMKLVGLICRTDLLHAKLGISPEGASTSSVNAHTTAGCIMRKVVVVARPDSPLSTACQVMLANKLSCLPVTQEDGTLVGILTGADFMRLALAIL